MKLNLSVPNFASMTGCPDLHQDHGLVIDTVAFDSRKIINGKSCAFFALKGIGRDGHDYIKDAYNKGVRVFVVHKDISVDYEDAYIIKVPDTLKALQELAGKYRQNFKAPVVGITGSAGKTMVKEWIYHLMNDSYKMVRSPKSYNSQLGAALSLLELNPEADLALIEAGISQPGEMEALEKMIHPDMGIFTSFGSAHAENFESTAIHLEEKLLFFKNCKKTFYSTSIQLHPQQISFIHGEKTDPERFSALLALSPFQDQVSRENLLLALHLASYFNIEEETLRNKIRSLPRLAMRMETFDGINNNLIINDAYNLDTDALRQSLEYQFSLAKGKKRVAIIAIDNTAENKIREVDTLLDEFGIGERYLLREHETPPVADISDSIILIKGSRSINPQLLSGLFQLKKHKTVLEVDFGAIRSNLNYYRSHIRPETKLMAMIKAASYGSGAEKMGEFLQKAGIDYLGVAYTDEGVELRKAGITTPIFVMNAEDDTFEDIINYNLEPALFSFEMMDDFIKALIMMNKLHYPIHIELDTGMRRLGFDPNEIDKVLEVILSQPELKVQGIFSHLADADNFSDDSYSYQQISLFKEASEKVLQRIPYPVLRHILNTEGTIRYPQAQFEMVRIGIGLYGFSPNPEVAPHIQAAIQWKTVVSQLKNIEPGDSVSYNRKFIAQRSTRIAIVPIGYADGYRRSMGYEKGSMYINGQACPVIGTVCMDMCMLDVTDIIVSTGDEVEIIGPHQRVEKVAEAMGTIPYEVLSAVSKRVHRVYIED